MNSWLMHLPVLPIVAPLLAGAIMLLLPESRLARSLLSTVSILIQILGS